jgi:glutathione S-transferase
MLKIYGADLSSPANKVRMTANVLGIDYEYIRVSIKDRENRTEEHLKMHPAGKVPVINDNGFILFESDAIVKYLASKNKSPLYPDEEKQRALVDQWMDFSTIHVGSAMGRVVFNRVFASFARVPVDERSLKDGMKFLNRFLPVIEKQLSKEEHLSGEEFSLADIGLLTMLDPAEVAEVDLTSYESIMKWRSGLQQKDFYTKCHVSYGEALKTVMARR